MTITVSLGFNPIWYFVDNNGKPLSGGKLYSYSSLNKSQQKFIYTDPQAQFPYPDPIIINANGTLGPLYFVFDSTAPDDLYFLLVTDANGVEIWTVDNYIPGTGDGGGSTTVGLDIENLITNNVFYRHCSTITGVPTYSVIAPSNNSSLVANGTTTSNPSPDIVFIKDNTSATDTITFPEFALGATPIVDQITPVDYFNYTCTVAGSGETVKCLQFPITAKVQNLSSTDIIGTFWGIATGGLPQVVELQLLQYFGDGSGASTPVITTINTYSLSTSWVQYNYSITIPTVGGKTLGGPPYGGAANSQNEGPNDGLFFRISFPLSPNTCNIGITKPTMYVGDILSNVDFHSYDYIDSIISLPRTGDVRVSLNSFAPFGWVLCNDGVLTNGNQTVVLPSGVPSARNNEDTYPLYSLIWSIGQANPTYAPIYDSAGIASTFGASAIADYEASKQLSLTKQLGRALSSAGMASGGATTFNVGQSTGVEAFNLTQANLPALLSAVRIGTTTINVTTSGSTQINSVGGVIGTTTNIDVGADTAISQYQPTSFYNVFLKL